MNVTLVEVKNMCIRHWK